MKKFQWMILMVALTAFYTSLTTHPSSAWAEMTKIHKLKKSGAQLWAQNCVACHNLRPPGMYSDKQWETLTHHMQVRAKLTREETKAIREFLQSAN